MAKLDTQTKLVSGVLNFPLKGEEFEDFDMVCEYAVRLRAYLTSVADEWAFILHSCDIPEDAESASDGDGVVEDNPVVAYYHAMNLKVPHIHFVFRASKRTRLMTWIYRIAYALGYDKAQRNLVSVENCKCVPFAIQYLVHYNHAEKYQYSVSDIVTNLTQKQLQFYFESDGTYIDVETLIDLVRTSDSQTDIIRRIGLETYMKYRYPITTIFLEMKQNPSLLYAPKPMDKGKYKPLDVGKN